MTNQNNSLTFHFTPSAPGYKKGVFCVVCGYKGVTTGRMSTPIKKLQNPNEKLWAKKTKRFEGRLSPTDVANNDELDKLESWCEEAIVNPKIKTPADFIEAFKAETLPNPVESFGDFLLGVINGMKTAPIQRPSRNYQNYINLYNKLKKEGNIIRVPVEDIDNRHFIQFSKFILSLPADEGRSNYVKLMNLFKQAHGKAVNDLKNQNTLRFKYRENAPTKQHSKRDSLTVEEYRKFEELDLSAIKIKGANNSELYHDFCMFLYEMKMRPVDAIHSHTSQIVALNGNIYIQYIPEKKKNSLSPNAVTYAPITKKANAIIQKYKGLSEKGYIFPFKLNQRDWDYNNPSMWNTWNNCKSKSLECVNKWLKKAGAVMGLDFPLILYTFRHSCLSHLCMQESANWGRIALEAGTSIKMLETHYVSNII